MMWPLKYLLTRRLSPEGRLNIFTLMGKVFFRVVEQLKILQEARIRSEFSAPYDTNPFVERARRTIFEGVCTAFSRWCPGKLVG